MKNTLLLALYALVTSTSFSQTLEMTKLIRDVRNDSLKSSIKVHTIDLLNYDDTHYFDLSRKTSDQLIEYCGINKIDLSGNIDQGTLEVDNQLFLLRGENDITVDEIINFRIDDELYENAVKLIVQENYYLLNEIAEDTLVYYYNTYYSFVHDSSIVFEAFHKERIFRNIVGETFEGITSLDNDPVQPNRINLLVTPNPTATGATIEILFDLPHSGDVGVIINNTQGTYSEVIFSGNMSAGTQQIEKSLSKNSSGVYTISVFFDGSIYSSTLIIQ